MSRTVTPYGEWVSPISATAMTAAARRLSFPAVVGDEVWWSEDRPHEGGRTAVMARRGDGTLAELLPAPWSARNRVHEYGGRSFLAAPGPDGPALVFVNFADQRLYRLDPATDPPSPLTPEPSEDDEVRYADPVLSPDGSAVWCVRERLHGGDVHRHLVAVPLDSSAGKDPAAVRELVGGSRFLANPRPSPDGTRLAWLAWDHPNMPWDGTELRVGWLAGDGSVANWSTVLGGVAESVFQPEWEDDANLLAVSDRSGWWNLYRVPAPVADPADRADHDSAALGGEVTALYPAPEEFGAPLWQLGYATYGQLGDGRLLCVHGTGSQRLGILDPAAGSLTDLDLPYQTLTPTLAIGDGRAAVAAGSATRPGAVLSIDPSAGTWEVVRTALDPDNLPDQAWLPDAESLTLAGPGGREVHVHLYRPTSPDHTGPEGTAPPYVTFVHGGPTSHSPAVFDLAKAYFTSRGIGVLDVNYGGSTGYGRAYRERLTGRWGVVDVEDTVAAVKSLVARGEADPTRLAIRGGSAGGWTTLCAVVGSDVFAAGTSIFGVTDVRRLAEITHDFESRYVEKLVGEEVLADDTRSPLHRADQTRCPVLLLQGSDDPIVPLEQAEQFRDALQANGLPHALMVLDGEMHGFRRAESIIAATEAELSFYGLIMGFQPPGVPVVPLSG
jgi:dipeptidyl aminopeptidase/acylaminoacyl peptidase